MDNFQFDSEAQELLGSADDLAGLAFDEAVGFTENSNALGNLNGDGEPLDGSNGSLGGGQVGSPPPKTSAKRASCITQHSWVINLPGSSSSEGTEHLEAYQEISWYDVKKFLDRYAKKWVFQQEVSPDGHRHFQGLCWLHCKRRTLTFCKLFHTFFHGSDSRQFSDQRTADWELSEFYCTKRDTRVGGPWSMGIPYIQAAPPVGCISVPDMYPWQKYVWETVNRDPDLHPKGARYGARVIHWVWSHAGCTGKTALAKTIFNHVERTLIINGKSADIASRVILFGAPRVVLMNLSRGTDSKYVAYAALEAIKDGLVCSGKYEGGQLSFAPPWVVVFANAPPNFQAMSMDRWEVLEVSTDEYSFMTEQIFIP